MDKEWLFVGVGISLVLFIVMGTLYFRSGIFG